MLRSSMTKLMPTSTTYTKTRYLSVTQFKILKNLVAPQVVDEVSSSTYNSSGQDIKKTRYLRDGPKVNLLKSEKIIGIISLLLGCLCIVTTTRLVILSHLYLVLLF